MEGLESALWPIHLKPRPGELLSSWMVRFAHGHGYKTEKMCRLLFGRHHSLWSRDVDRLAPQAVLSKLCEVTGATTEVARQTTLAAFSGYLAEQTPIGGHIPWLIPLHVYHRQRTAPGLMYCPRCLDADDVPFYRRTWRLAFVTACCVHGTLLKDTCPNCSSPVIPHRVDIGRDGIRPRDLAFTKCWRCNFKLNTARTVDCSNDLSILTKRLEGALNDGFIDWSGNSNLHSVSYFLGLRIIARFIARTEGMRDKSIELLPLNQRIVVIQELTQLLEAWPEKFIYKVKYSGYTYSDVVGTRTKLPYWIELAIDELKRSQHPERTSDEINAILQVTDRHGAKFSSVRKLYGAHISREQLPATCRSTVSNDNHEALMVALDHLVAQSSDQKKRTALLQDKVMICLYRFTKLSSAEICELKFEDFPKVEKELKSGDLPSNTQGRSQALQLFRWHLLQRKSEFSNAPYRDFVFCSPYTDKLLSASALHTRFGQSVSAALLTAPIPNMRAYKLR